MIVKSQVQREDLPTCQGYLVKREPTDISYVFPEAGLTLLRVFQLSLPLGSFTSDFFSLSLAPLSCVCILKNSVRLTVSFPPFQFCCCSLCCTLACAQKQSVSLLIILCSEPEIHTSQWRSPFLSLHFFFLACFNCVPTTASLSTSCEWKPDSNQHAVWQITWGFTAGDSSTEKLSLSLSFPLLPALFQQPTSSPILPR